MMKVKPNLKVPNLKVPNFCNKKIARNISELFSFISQLVGTFDKKDARRSQLICALISFRYPSSLSENHSTGPREMDCTFSLTSFLMLSGSSDIFSCISPKTCSLNSSVKLTRSSFFALREACFFVSSASLRTRAIVDLIIFIRWASTSSLASQSAFLFIALLICSMAKILRLASL